MKVLIVEDEPKIARVLADYFEREGFVCAILGEGTHAVETIRECAPDFVVLDLMLPGRDGLTICREVRRFSEVPILMLTAKVDEVERLLGLELGADDYVCKPFSPREVVTRAKTILRRVKASAPQVPGGGVQAVHARQYRGVVVSEERFTCTVNGHAVTLTPVELRLLATLIAVPGRVYTRQRLIELAYEDQRVVSDRTVDSHMRNLRKKLEVHLDEQLIHSIYGVGYKLE